METTFRRITINGKVYEIHCKGENGKGFTRFTVVANHRHLGTFATIEAAEQFIDRR